MWVRLLRRWWIHGKMDLLWTLRDVPTVLTFLVSDTIVAVGAVTGIFLLAARFGGIGHWGRDQVLFMLGYALLVTGLPDILFNYNVSFISRRIGRGQLDHLLVQPQPLWMALLTEGFSPVSGAIWLAPGPALLLWAGARLGLHVTPGWLGLLALNVAASAAVALAFTFAWGSLAFWAPRAAEEINTATWDMLRQLKPFPLDGVAPALLGGLLTAVPVGFLAWYPCRALLGLDAAPYAVWVTPLAAVVASALAAALFRRGLHHYGRTGSQRYLSLGHRR